MNKILKNIFFATYIIIFQSCNVPVLKKLEYNQPLSIKFCDSSLWIKKFKITYFKKNNKFDSMLKIQEFNRSSVEFYFYPKNSYGFVFPEPNYDADIKFEIYGNNDSILIFNITNIKIIEKGYGHDRHAALGSYTINNIESKEKYGTMIEVCSFLNNNKYKNKFLQ